MKKGFSLVELLIVLTIFTALIAIVTPIALNAISKAKATQIAENIILIRDSLTETVLLTGKIKYGTTLNDLVRNIDDDYWVYYYTENGIFHGYVQYEKKDFSLEKLQALIPEIGFPEETISFKEKDAVEMKKEESHHTHGDLFGLNDPWHGEFSKLLYDFRINLY